MCRDQIARGVKLLVRDPRRFALQLGRLWKRGDRHYDEKWAMSLREWLAHHQAQQVAANPCRWMGIPTQKCPLDAWIMHEILFEIRPDVVVEIRSAQGGSSLFLAHLLDLVDNGRVVFVDIDRSELIVARQRRITTITGDSGDPEVIEAVERECAGHHTLVIHDGDHATSAVLRDPQSYAPLVSMGSYFVVEDGIIDRYRPGEVAGFGTHDGPLLAIK